MYLQSVQWDASHKTISSAAPHNETQTLTHMRVQLPQRASKNWFRRPFKHVYTRIARECDGSLPLRVYIYINELYRVRSLSPRWASDENSSKSSGREGIFLRSSRGTMAHTREVSHAGARGEKVRARAFVAVSRERSVNEALMDSEVAAARSVSLHATSQYNAPLIYISRFTERHVYICRGSSLDPEVAPRQSSKAHICLPARYNSSSRWSAEEIKLGIAWISWCSPVSLILWRPIFCLKNGRIFYEYAVETEINIQFCP